MMPRRVGVGISVGLAESLNPSTVGPALYLATVRNRVWRVTQFTIGVFSVTFAGGVVLTIGPGRLLLGLVPHPQGTVRHVIELVAGVVLLIVAVALWRGRRSLGPASSGRSGSGGSALGLGASIAGVELPTAGPVFRGYRGARGLKRKRAAGAWAARPLQRSLRAAAAGDRGGHRVRRRARRPMAPAGRSLGTTPLATGARKPASVRR
jgi:cytochrome c biogenesis protein CcdA